MMRMRKLLTAIKVSEAIQHSYKGILLLLFLPLVNACGSSPSEGQCRAGISKEVPRGGEAGIVEIKDTAETVGGGYRVKAQVNSIFGHPEKSYDCNSDCSSCAETTLSGPPLKAAEDKRGTSSNGSLGDDAAERYAIVYRTSSGVPSQEACEAAGSAAAAYLTERNEQKYAEWKGTESTACSAYQQGQDAIQETKDSLDAADKASERFLRGY